MKMYTKLTIGLVALMMAVGCSKKEDAPPADDTFGGGTGGSLSNGGSGGANAGGTGGSTQGGSGGQAQGGSSQAGGGGQAQGGEAGQGQGGQGLDGGVDALSDSGKLDALPDVPPPEIDTCAEGTIAFGSKNLMAGGSTPQQFMDAYNAELSAMTTPGPLLVELHGLDVADESASAWKMKFGGLVWDAASSKASFLSTPAEVPFTFQSGYGLMVGKVEATFKLHFPSVDIPVAGFIRIGAQLNDSSCSQFMLEELTGVILKDEAGDLVFHGSKISDLMGPPTEDWAGGVGNAWTFTLAGQSDIVALK